MAKTRPDQRLGGFALIFLFFLHQGKKKISKSEDDSQIEKANKGKPKKNKTKSKHVCET